MSKQENDILLIRKYLNGELDARAMYELERRAQDDPFLMDALAGYEANGVDQDKNLDELAGRLQQRTAKKERRLIPFRVMAIAASVLIFLTAGLIWLMNRQPEAKLLTAKVTIVPAKKHDTLPAATNKQPEIAELKSKQPAKTYLEATDKSIATNKTHWAKKKSASAEVMLDEVEANPVADVASVPPQYKELKKDTTPLNEMIVMGYAKQKRTSVTGRLAEVSLGIPKNGVVSGIVKDETGPLPGATVKIKGTSIATVTDADGRFKLRAVPDSAVLALAYVGYLPKEVKVTKAEPMVIAMVPNSQSLSEVVTVGYGTKKDDDADNTTQYLAARPANGWSDFKKHIKDNAASPDGKTGTVKLSFTVNADGELSDFKIIKSLGDKTDAAAIALIQNGPDWLPNSDKKPEKIKVKVKFEAKK